MAGLVEAKVLRYRVLLWGVRRMREGMHGLRNQTDLDLNPS